MSKQTEAYFIPYEESGYPDREKRIRETYRANQRPLPENYTLKKCGAHLGPQQICAKPAKWVRMSTDPDVHQITEFAVCDEHKTDNNWTATPIEAKGKRTITYGNGDISHYLTIQDEIIGEFTVQIWLNQSSGRLSSMIIDEKPSVWLKQLQEDAEKNERRY